MSLRDVTSGDHQGRVACLRHKSELYLPHLRLHLPGPLHTLTVSPPTSANLTTASAAMKGTGGKAPRRQSKPFRPSGLRGVPTLATATFEPPPAPPPLPASPHRLRKRPGAKKKTAVKKAYKAEVEAAESPKSFTLLGLPAELRTQIYELCVSTANYITYDDQDVCTCSTESLNKKHEQQCKFKGDDPVNPSFRPRLPGRFYAKVVQHHLDLKSFTPPILQANRQIRNEPLPVFFAVNDFVFEDCDAR